MGINWLELGKDILDKTLGTEKQAYKNMKDATVNALISLVVGSIITLISFIICWIILGFVKAILVAAILGFITFRIYSHYDNQADYWKTQMFQGAKSKAKRVMKTFFN